MGSKVIIKFSVLFVGGINMVVKVIIPNEGKPESVKSYILCKKKKYLHKLPSINSITCMNWKSKEILVAGYYVF